MRRTLFAREFRSALLPNLVTVGAILATLILLERIYGLRLGKAEDIREFTDLALLVGLVVSGFISGERCFPSEMKESRMLFLSSLPISRSWTWLSIVSARLLAAVISIALGVALRRPFPELRDSRLLRLDIGLTVVLILFAYVLFFSAGALLALLSRRTLFSYIAGFLVLGILLLEILLATCYPSVGPSLPEIWIPPLMFADSLRPVRMVSVLSPLLILWLLLSWRFFIQGEIGNWRRRIRNQILFGLGTTVYLGLVILAASSPKLTSIGDTWRIIDSSGFGWQGKPYGVSSDGRYLFVFEFLDRSPFMVRVSIVDTASGKVTGQWMSGGIGWGNWSNPGHILNLLALNNSPLDRWGYLVPGTVDWIRLSPEGREISRRRFQGVAGLQALAGGRSLVVLREGEQGRIILLDGFSGHSSEVARAPLDGNVSLRQDGSAAWVFFDNVLMPRRSWIVDSRARDVRVPRSAVETPYILSGEVLGSAVDLQAALRRRFAPPARGESPLQGRFLLPDQYRLWRVIEGNGVYFLADEGSEIGIWARSTSPKGRWEKLPDVIPALARLFRESTRSPEQFIDFDTGTGVFLSAGGDTGRFYVYDPQLGVIPEAGSCIRRGKAFISLQRAAGLQGLLIELTCTDASPSRQDQTYYFEHLPGSREVRAIGMGAARYPSSHLYFDERGSDIWRSSDFDAWSSAPGRKDLLLWRGR